MAFSTNSGGVRNEINVTPLVDVVLVLLIIFMVVTPMLERGMDVKLPKAQSSDQEKDSESLIISVTRDRAIWWDTTKVSVDALRKRLADQVKSDPDRKILIKGDEALLVKDVRSVLAEAKSAGAKGVSLAVDDKKKK
jgi:biopolymer transport protein ExbD/biopolymer transport protein TolR